MEIKGNEKIHHKFIPYPVLNKIDTEKVWNILIYLQDFKIIKKGMNEVLNSINKDRAEIVIMSTDADPIELLSNIPKKLDDKKILYCFIKSSKHLGKACGIKRKAICSSIEKSENINIKPKVSELKNLLFNILN